MWKEVGIARKNLGMSLRLGKMDLVWLPVVSA